MTSNIAQFTFDSLDLYQLTGGSPRGLSTEEKRKLQASIVKAYNAGYTVRAVAALTNTSYGYVHGQLVRNHVDLRSRHAYRKTVVKG
jgi:hypothetical protein